MLSICEADKAIRSVYRIARAHSDALNVETIADLKAGYHDFLASRQPALPVNRSDDCFVRDLEAQQMLGAAFGKGSLNDLDQEHLVGGTYERKLLERKIDLARGALEEVMDSSEDFASVFDLVIHSVFIKASRPSRHSLGSHGGSTSGSIGAIWFSVSDGVCHRDLVEMFVHELTHHLLFIDELNCPQFNYDLIVRPEVGNIEASPPLR